MIGVIRTPMSCTFALPSNREISPHKSHLSRPNGPFMFPPIEPSPPLPLPNMPLGMGLFGNQGPALWRVFPLGGQVRGLLELPLLVPTVTSIHSAAGLRLLLAPLELPWAFCISRLRSHGSGSSVDSPYWALELEPSPPSPNGRLLGAGFQAPPALFLAQL